MEPTERRPEFLVRAFCPADALQASDHLYRRELFPSSLPPLYQPIPTWSLRLNSWTLSELDTPISELLGYPAPAFWMNKNPPNRLHLQGLYCLRQEDHVQMTDIKSRQPSFFFFLSKTHPLHARVEKTERGKEERKEAQHCFNDP